jgi:hypothetical protein|tara:strand:+ start:681 stop:1364 length:684 start_codon:yes stop_codon:yes gene_type:complete
MTTYTLTEMFPNIDESVISYIYTETNGNLEESINLILEMIKKSDISNYVMKPSQNSNASIKQKTQDFLNLDTSIVIKDSKSKYNNKETNDNNDEIIAKTLNDEILARTIQDILMFDYINNNQNNQEQISTKKKKEHITNKKNFFKKFGKKFTELFSKFSCGCVGLNNKKEYSQIDMEEPLNDDHKNMDENSIYEVKTEDISLEIEEEPSLQYMNKSPRSISSSKIFI